MEHCWREWWRHQMETFSALLAICAGNSPVPTEFPGQRPVTRSFGVFFDLRLNKRLSKQSWGWWFETLPRPLWRHSNVNYVSSDCQRFDKISVVPITPFLGLDFFSHPEIWQAPRQQRCRDACQISERYDHCNIQSRGFETSQDLRVRRLLLSEKSSMTNERLFRCMLLCWTDL